MRSFLKSASQAKPFECPECARVAIGTVDLCPATALLTVGDDGKTASYSGESRMHWDGQTTEVGPKGLPLLTCGEHEWECHVEIQ